MASRPSNILTEEKLELKRDSRQQHRSKNGTNTTAVGHHLDSKDLWQISMVRPSVQSEPLHGVLRKAESPGERAVGVWKDPPGSYCVGPSHDRLDTLA